MQQFDRANDDAVSTQECASLMLEVVPQVMRFIRAEMRRQYLADLSVTQFRALRLVQRHGQTSLTEVAQHVDLTAAAASRMIDGLVTRGMVARQMAATDRRFIALSLTEQGEAVMEAARKETEASLTRILSALGVDDVTQVQRTLLLLQQLFTQEEISPPLADTQEAGSTR